MTKGRPTVRVGDVVTISKTMKELQPTSFAWSLNSLLDHGWQVVSVNHARSRRQRVAAWLRRVVGRG